MKHSDYQQLPQGVRDRFASYPDEIFAGHYQVIAARRVIEEAKARHQESVASTSALAAQKAALEGRLEQAKANLQAQRETRRKAVVDALLGEREIPVIDQRTESLVEVIEAIPDAIAVVEKEFFSAQQKSQRTCDATIDANLELERLLEKFKLDRAWSESA